MRTRRARASDAEAIYRLVAHYAEQGLLLPRTQEEIRRHIGHFLVREEKGQVVGCLALETYGSDLAEIRSLAVQPEIRGRGIGAQMIEHALIEARRRDIARVFAVTHARNFFCATDSRRLLASHSRKKSSGIASPVQSGARAN